MVEQVASAAKANGVRLRTALITAALAVVVLALWPALRGQLVYDDLWLVGRNPALESWDSLSKALFRPHWDFIEPNPELRVGYWRPLAIVGLYLARQLGGGSTFAYHALALGLHLASTAVVFLLAERLARDTWLAFAAALVFGLHPVQVESVAWISALNDPLSGFFALAASLAFVRWRERGSSGMPLLACLSFFLALLSKESAIAWVLLALCLDVARGGTRPFVRAYGPVLGVIALYWLARVVVFEEASAGFLRITSYLRATPLREVTLRLELLGGALALLVWPAKLNLFREVRPEIPLDDAQLWIAVGAIVLWAAAAWFAWRQRERLVFAALLFVPAAIAPAVVRYESIGRFPLSDRLLYVAVFGFALLAAALLRRLPRLPSVAAIGALAALYGVRSFARTEYWKDELTVFREGARASPRSIYVQWGLGRVLLDRFQTTGDLEVLLEANDAFTKAQDIALERPPDPSVLDTPFDELQSSLGVGWFQLFCALSLPQECTLEEAELVFRELVKRAGTNADARCGLGVTLRHMGRLDEAEAELRKAVEVNPLHHQSWFNLGRLSLERQKWSDALEQFQRYLELVPDDADGWTWLGMAAIELDLGDRARKALGRARALAPGSAEPLVQLGIMAARERRFEVALDFLEQALAVDGANGPAHLSRAKTLVALGREGEAIQAFLDAGRWLQEGAPDPFKLRQAFEAFYNAGVLTAQRGHPKEALPMLEEALRRDPEGRWVPELRAQVEKLRGELEKTQ